MKLSMWHSGESHSRCTRSAAQASSLPADHASWRRQPGLKYSAPNSQSAANGPHASLNVDQRGTCGVSATLLSTTLLTPCTVRADNAIAIVIEPTQCAITC